MSGNESSLVPTACRQMVGALRLPIALINRAGLVLYANEIACNVSAYVGKFPVSLETLWGITADQLNQWLSADWWQNPTADTKELTDISDLCGRRVSRITCARLQGDNGEPCVVLYIEWASSWEERYLDALKSLDGATYALEASEERFNVLFRESSDPVVILNTAGQILSANTGFEEYTGLDTYRWFNEEKKWADCVHPEELSLLLAGIKTCTEQGRTEMVELRLFGAQQQFQWFELSLSPLHDERRQIHGIVGVARNIDRRKERETALREQAASMQHRHDRAQLLVDKLKEFFSQISGLPTEVEDYCKGVTTMLAEMFGSQVVIMEVYDPVNARYVGGKGKDDEKIVPLASSLHQALVQSGGPVYCNTLDVTAPYRDDASIRDAGLRTYLGAPLRDSKGKTRGVLCMLDSAKRDYSDVDVELFTVAALHIAARLRAEEQERMNRKLSDHLRQAQKMEAVGMLAGGIAHDFNNILGGILGFASYLSSKADADSPLYRDLQLIEQSAVRAAELTRQLLTFARRKHFAKQPLSINDLIEEVLSLAQRSAARDVSITKELDPDLPLVNGDSGQLHQALMNLCLNAAEAMREKEQPVLRIVTERRALTAREQVILGETKGARFICITIEDNGRGMSQELQEHIFEPFYTTKSGQGGSGLGLSIVYGIVSNHNGHVTLDSEEGQGTVFTLYLPEYDGEVIKQEEKEEEELSGSETVLIVDDEPIIRQMVMQVLKASGYQVICAATGFEAIDHVRELGDRLDLVFLDMVMPEIDGEETFYAIHKQLPDLPILLTSGFVKDDKRERLLAAGAVGMVFKPYNNNELLSQIRKALDQAKKKASS